jgi:uncharacterized protein
VPLYAEVDTHLTRTSPWWSRRGSSWARHAARERLHLGHGVCGISRLSLRGMVATVFYILAGGITIVLFRHILGVI